MGELVAKALLSGILIAAISELGRRLPAVGALLASLPLISILSLVLLWRERIGTAKLADFAEATFWLVLPSLPLYLLVATMLRHGVAFWPALGVGCLLTVMFYVITFLIAPRLGLKL